MFRTQKDSFSTRTVHFSHLVSPCEAHCDKFEIFESFTRAKWFPEGFVPESRIFCSTFSQNSLAFLDGHSLLLRNMFRGFESLRKVFRHFALGGHSKSLHFHA